MIVGELPAKPRPRDIHTQTVKRDFDASVGHLPHGTAVGLVVRHAYSGAGETIVDGSIGGESQGFGRVRTAGPARRNFDGDRRPIVGGERFAVSRRWSTRDSNLIGVLEFRCDPRTFLTGELIA